MISLTDPIKQQVAKVLNLPSSPSFSAVGGGCINQCFRVDFEGASWFMKLNNAATYPQMLLSESHGLNLLRRTGTIRVPEVLHVFEAGGMQVMIQQWIQASPASDEAWQSFGEHLAALHACTSENFGLDFNNYMGSVPQYNDPQPSWTDFFIAQRLQPLIKACLDKALLTGSDITIAEKVYPRVDEIFGTSRPSLVHGDLWSGNYMSAAEEIILIDPAPYYGHPAADLGMTQLFGGFPRIFYDAYQHHGTMPGEDQILLANLYPLLVHLLLFGSGYAAQVRHTLRQFS